MFTKAKESGLKVALHLCEVEGKASEAEVLMQLPPDRIGHGTFIHRESDSLTKKVLHSRVPLG